VVTPPHRLTFGSRMLHPVVDSAEPLRDLVDFIDEFVIVNTQIGAGTVFQ
jgi:hypothetical protein